MKTIAFFNTKPYDRENFDRWNTQYQIRYLPEKLSARTAELARGADAVCAFVNDTLDAPVIAALYQLGIRVVALRCAGFDNVDAAAAQEKIHILRVPAYSPYAVAEHAVGLLLSLNRHIHRAYARTRNFDFRLQDFTGIDLHGKTVGILGTGKIGLLFQKICRGFGMQTIAYDPYPRPAEGLCYLPFDEVLQKSDVLSLHCPLTPATYHLLDAQAFSRIKPGAFLINTSRGGLIDAQALLVALQEGRLRGAGLDVYEGENAFFFEDRSTEPPADATLAQLLAHPRVLMTSHQAFLTEEALQNIAQTTLGNLDAFFAGAPLENEIPDPLS